jgi:hypothetical protein
MTNAPCRQIATLAISVALLTGCAEYRAGVDPIPAGQNSITVTWSKAIKNSHGDDYAIAVTPEIFDNTGAIFLAGYRPCITVKKIDASSFNVFLQDCSNGQALTSQQDIRIDWAVYEWKN